VRGRVAGLGGVAVQSDAQVRAVNPVRASTLRTCNNIWRCVQNFIMGFVLNQEGSARTLQTPAPQSTARTQPPAHPPEPLLLVLDPANKEAGACG